MKYLFVPILCWMTLMSCTVHAASAAGLWAQIEALQNSTQPQRPAGRDPVALMDYLQAQARRGAALGDLMLEFVEKYPADSRYRDAVIGLTKIQRPVYRITGDLRTEGFSAVQADEAAEAAWSAKVTPHVERVLRDKEAPQASREMAYNYWISVARPGLRAPDPQGAREFRRRVDMMKAEFPQTRMLQMYELQYLNRLRVLDPAAVVAHLTALNSDPNSAIAAWAQGELNTEAMRTTPVAYKFTALDGREVDMSKLRGKVVLLDFWATWCGPCKAEIPNVVANYGRFHDKGFEVIAVSLDDEKDRQKLIDYVAENKLPWPQHFDGKGWKNEIASHHGISAIPAMFLFDQKGLLASTSARGEKLEAEIRRLLGL